MVEIEIDADLTKETGSYQVISEIDDLRGKLENLHPNINAFEEWGLNARIYCDGEGVSLKITESEKHDD